MCAAALTQTIRSYMVLHQMEHGNGAETTMVNPSLGQRALWRRVAAGLGTLRGRICPTKLTGSGAPPVGPVVDQRSPQVLTSIYGPCKEIWLFMARFPQVDREKKKKKEKKRREEEGGEGRGEMGKLAPSK